MALVITVGGNDITSKVRIESLTIHQAARDMAATCSFQVVDSGASVSITVKDAITIVDGATTYFKGEIAGTPERREIAPNKLVWSVDAQDYNQLLKETIVDAKSYASGQSDANTIIPDLFSTYRSDINSADYVTEVDASMEVLEFEAQTLAQAMRDICDMTGARFWVDFDKKLHYGQSPATSADGLSDAPDNVNTWKYWDLTRHYDIGIVNRVYVKGLGIAGWVEDATSISSYGEREVAVRDRTVTTSQGITDRGTGILNANKNPTTTYTLTTAHSGWSVGEKIELTSSVYSLAAVAMLVVEMTTTFLTGSKPLFDITLGDEFDDAVTRWQQQQDTEDSTWAQGHLILLYDAAKDTLSEYPATSAGLDDASGDASADDVIWIPTKTIDDNHTLTAEVHYVGLSRWATKLTGQITLANGTTLETMSIIRTANDASDLKGVVSPPSGTPSAKLRDCTITCTQSGAGGAYAVNFEGNTDVEVWNCYLDGSSTGGNGYACNMQSGTGNAYIYGGRCVGSTDAFNV